MPSGVHPSKLPPQPPTPFPHPDLAHLISAEEVAEAIASGRVPAERLQVSEEQQAS